MNNFNTKRGVLFYNYTIEAEQTAKIDKFLQLLDQSGVSVLLKKESTEQIMGRPELDSFRMFATIVYGFAVGCSSLREMETSCKVEFMLTAIGYNIRKFLRYSEKGLHLKYWTAPDGTVPESFKKPSA